MEKQLLEISILFTVMVLLVVFIIVLFILNKRNKKIEKKFNKHSLQKSTFKNKSLFDFLFEYVDKIKLKLSGFLSRFSFINNYSKKYERFIYFDENKKEVDFLVNNIFCFFITLITLSILYFTTYINLSILISILLISFFIPDLYVIKNFSNKRKEIENDLLKAVRLMNNSFKSGRTITQAIEIVKEEFSGSLKDEFSKIHYDITHGLDVSVAFTRFKNRIRIEEANYIAASITLLNKTGGNISKVFDSIERELTNKKRLKNELKTATSASVFVYRFLLFLPLTLVFILYFLNQDYFSVLFDSSLGLSILSIVVLLYAIYILSIKRIMRLEG